MTTPRPGFRQDGWAFPRGWFGRLIDTLAARCWGGEK